MPQFHCSKCHGLAIRTDEGFICANWIECDGTVSTDFADAFNASAKNFTAGMMRLAKQVTRAAEAFKALAKAAEGFADLRAQLDALDDLPPISDEALKSVKASTVCFAEMSTWNMPLEFIEWLVKRLPDAVSLRFAEMIQRWQL
jgi:hypothetical protein